MALSDLKSRIADELNRTDLTNQIDKAIRSAVAFYSSETLFFQEDRSTADTVDEQEYYALPDDLVTVNSLRVTVNGNNSYVLDYRSNYYFETVYQPVDLHTGYPEYWTIYDQQLRLYPIPDDAYPMVLHYIKRLATLGDDDDTNALIEDIEEQLIRARSKWDLYTNLIKDPQRAVEQKAIEMQTLEQVKKKSNMYIVDTHIEKYL
jgi:hypothetical protein